MDARSAEFGGVERIGRDERLEQTLDLRELAGEERRMQGTWNKFEMQRDITIATPLPESLSPSDGARVLKWNSLSSV
jgi:hypothetical protein